MNNLLLILGIIALSNGDISLFDTKNKSKKTIEGNLNSNPEKKKRSKKTQKSQNTSENTRSVKKVKKVRKKRSSERSNDIFNFNINDISQGMKLMELSDDDLERGMEIITRTKKYMSREERKILIKVESLLDLVRGIKKLTAIDMVESDGETDFFRSMDEEDKKNMMIKEIIEVFPEKRKESIEKAIDIKKKIDLFAELFLPDDFGEGGFSLSSLANINNLGSVSNLKLLGSLLRGDESSNNSYEDDDYEDDDNEYEDDEYEYEYEDYDEEDISYEEEIDYDEDE
ncbi:hypothetical protein [Romboutsia weinsteinii]|uniref:hypothetical protein n=1 Tax=Romboutsia weinsteinii TaxID=2020949 RepID=UPI001FB05F23|nr:hypothetical protein [Romboutsia weinsteinii]